MSVYNDTTDGVNSGLVAAPRPGDPDPGYEAFCDKLDSDFPNEQDIAWADEQDRKASTAGIIARGSVAAVNAVTALFERRAS